MGDHGMSEGKPLVFLSRRDLLKLMPPSVAAWVLAPTTWTKATQVASVRPIMPRSAVADDGWLPISDAKKWLAEWIWESSGVGPPGGPSPMNLFVYFRKAFDLDQ